MKCQKCGKKLRKNELFCTMCGYYNANSASDDQEKDFDLLNDDDNDVEIDNVSLDDSNDEPDFLECFIGEDYNLIKKSKFNIYSFIFNYIYFIYRKMYLIGILGLGVTLLVAIFLSNYFTIFILISMIVMGLFFNKIYVFYANMKIDKILKQYSGSDNYTLKKICAEKGGVNFIPAIVSYFAFLVLLVINIFNIGYKAKYVSKYFSQNNENKANCLSLVKTVYKDISKSHKVNEALCNIRNNDYYIYLKLVNDNDNFILLYKTEDGNLIYINDTSNINLLRNNMDNLSASDIEMLKEKEKIIDDYSRYTTKSKKEDQDILKRKDTGEKLNYLFLRDEIIR